MPSSYTPLLRLTLPADGELVGTWGQTVNNGITSLEEAAIAGTAVVAMADANQTLTVGNGVADQARNMVLRATGALTAQRDIVVPSLSKLYLARNATTGGFGVQVKTAAGTGVVVPPGSATLLYCDGTDVLPATSGEAGKFADGTAALPSIAFTNDPDTGIWRPGADRIGFAVNGLQRWEISAGGVLASGSETTPIPVVNGVTGRVNLPGISETGSTYVASRWDANSAGPGLYFGKSRDVTVGTFTPGGACQTGDVLGLIGFSGSDGVQLSNGNTSANIFATAAENFTPAATGAALNFHTDPIGGNVGALRLSLDSAKATFTMPVRGPIASAALPTYAFDGDIDTGMYSSGANNIDWACAGALRMNLNDQGLTVFSPGDAFLTVKSTGGSSDDDAIIIIDAHDDGEPELRFSMVGAEQALISWSGTGSNLVTQVGGLTISRHFGSVFVQLAHTAAVTTTQLLAAREVAFSRISDTSLRVSMRGNDGIVRGVNLAIAP